ncbi:uncharacterized protein LOC120273665 [Dioscorea cayenensis subsp. rotundata]|uniref:Uncharacterized protein LOC120273665 n=1 Tax=Dioscorea cayennensis subsp. rotundata TaxID=55577 RepID=A0AB40CD85_DIOCR|nr:uncharacterized protein LOC120273665 [Dioscorea cayenensis subsp. rotundata]
MACLSLFVFLASLVFSAFPPCYVHGIISCIETEKIALLSQSGALIIATTKACSLLGWPWYCKWQGVSCNHESRHVIKLDLRQHPPNYISDYHGMPPSKLNSSLIQLHHLKHLDLSMNNFNDSPIPDFIGSFAKLEYLNLSNAGFSGAIPHTFGNLSCLRYLDLSSNYDLQTNDLHWLSGMTSLYYLDLSGGNLSKVHGWLHDINSGGIYATTDLPHYLNFTSLRVLDLSHNNGLNITLPQWLFNLTSLVYLDLFHCALYGKLLVTIGNLRRLRVLNLSGNHFDGVIPESLGNLGSLERLDLSDNELNGSIPESLSNLTNLVYFDLSNNKFGKLPESIGRLQKLVEFHLSNNQIQGLMPASIGDLRNLQYLDLSQNMISGAIPESFGNLTLLQHFDGAVNNLRAIPESFGNLVHLQILRLFQNMIAGELPGSMGKLTSLTVLDLSMNNISGILPKSMGNLCKLQELDLSSNLIKGTIDDLVNCLSNCPENYIRNSSSVSEDTDGIWYLNLANNRFNGRVPESIGRISSVFPAWLKTQSSGVSFVYQEAEISAMSQHGFGIYHPMVWFVFIFDELISRHKVHVDVQGIKTKLQELSRSREVYGISNIGETIGTTSQSRNQNVIPILPQLSDDIDMVGFDDEKKNILQELVDINNTNRSVISIVGIGGLGKTTLAKTVYNDHQVRRSFDIFAWAIISQQYTILEILKGILSEKSETSPEDTIQTLSVKVIEKLKKGKYLVVLDDVWKADVWNELIKVFPDDNNGSRVIITTRFANVAKIANPTFKVHELRCLDEKESQELILRKVFPRQDIETCCPINLVEYAHQLVERCGGLPLAVVVLGGLVSTKPQTKDAWKKVIENMKGLFVEGGEKCLEILSLSYSDLPYYLKLCFLYFGCFKEDEEIPTKTIIRLWSCRRFSYHGMSVLVSHLQANPPNMGNNVPKNWVALPPYLYKEPLKMKIPSDNIITIFSPINTASRNCIQEFQDPMATLEKLPCLKYLKLCKSYRGKQMICSANKFQLLSLEIEYLKKPEEWKMRRRQCHVSSLLQIDRCYSLKMIPKGLKNVPLDQLKLGGMSRYELRNR